MALATGIGVALIAGIGGSATPEYSTNVKFIDGANLTYSPEIIRNADVVWIQNNCISHSQYWSIVKNCKRAGVQMRYFRFASEEKYREELEQSGSSFFGGHLYMRECNANTYNSRLYLYDPV